MKRKKLFICFAVVVITFITVYQSVAAMDKRIPFMPIDYNKVDSVLISGFKNKDDGDVDLISIIHSLNNIKEYDRRSMGASHSTPGPEWSIIIMMKDKHSVTLYRDYDGETKISDSHTAYIINKDEAQKVLDENNLLPIVGM